MLSKFPDSPRTCSVFLSECAWAWGFAASEVRASRSCACGSGAGSGAGSGRLRCISFLLRVTRDAVLGPPGHGPSTLEQRRYDAQSGAEPGGACHFAPHTLPAKPEVNPPLVEHQRRALAGLRTLGPWVLLTHLLCATSQAWPSVSIARSFPITAAGQFQDFTGFPFHLDQGPRTRALQVCQPDASESTRRPSECAFAPVVLRGGISKPKATHQETWRTQVPSTTLWSPTPVARKPKGRGRGARYAFGHRRVLTRKPTRGSDRTRAQSCLRARRGHDRDPDQPR